MITEKVLLSWSATLTSSDKSTTEGYRIIKNIGSIRLTLLPFSRVNKFYSQRNLLKLCPWVAVNIAAINLLCLIIQYAAGFCLTKPVQIWYSTSVLNCDKTLSLLTSKSDDYLIGDVFETIKVTETIFV